MGVPFYFSVIGRKCLIQNKLNDIDTFYIDANGIFHSIGLEYAINNPNDDCTCTSISYNDDVNDACKFCTSIFELIIDRLQEMCDYTNAKNVHILVDGVVPLAKIIKQRKGRYSSVQSKMINTKFRNRTNKPQMQWTNAVITPGTPFMVNLHKHLLLYSELYNYSYSSYEEFGEGEHKIMNLIDKGENNIVISSPDADIFFLSLLKNRSNIYILRDLKYYSIDLLKEHVNVEFGCTVEEYTLLCMFCGNDFVPDLKGISMSHSTYGYLKHIYKKVKSYLNKPLIDTAVNDDFICLIINELTNYRDSSQHNKSKFKCEYDELVWKFEHGVYDKYDPVKLDEKRYYEYVFNIEEDPDISIKTMCVEYIKAIKWTFNYYKGCNSENISAHYYPYAYAPLVDDLSKQIFNNNISYSKTILPKKIKVSMIKQMLLVIPKCYITYINTSHDVIKLYNKKSLQYLFEKPKVDNIQCQITWKAPVTIPYHVKINKFLAMT